MRRLTALAAAVALSGAVLVCHDAGASESRAAEAEGHRHAHGAPQHHDSAPAHDHSTSTDLSQDCQTPALATGAPVSVEAPGFTAVWHAAIPVPQSGGEGFLVAKVNPPPPIPPPTLVQQHVLIRI